MGAGMKTKLTLGTLFFALFILSDRATAQKILESMSLFPPEPDAQTSFTIKVSSLWRNTCPKVVEQRHELDGGVLTVHASVTDGGKICGQAFTRYSFEEVIAGGLEPGSYVIRVVINGRMVVGKKIQIGKDHEEVLSMGYTFLAERTFVGVTGGIAGIDVNYGIRGGFTFVQGKDKAAFRDVRATLFARQDTQFSPIFDGDALEKVFKLTELEGVRVTSEAQLVYRFDGEIARGVPLRLDVIVEDRQLLIRGATEPPCCDFFQFRMKAASVPSTKTEGLFLAYNDLSWGEGQTTQNITRFTTDAGAGAPPDGSRGALVDFVTGKPTSATVEIKGGHWDGDKQTTYGALSDAGTDGYRVFRGKVDAKGVLSYAQEEAVITFRALNPDLAYHLTLFGNRNHPGYTNRLTRSTISGVAHFVNTSSLGADYEGPMDETTTIAHGFNTENGYVVSYTDIRPGSDGTFSVTLSKDVVSEDALFYANAFCLEAVEPEKAYITQIGFSNRADGDQDVTHFMDDEVLYVQVHDVDLSSGGDLFEPTVFVELTQGSVRNQGRLTRDAATGTYQGRFSLQEFRAGEVVVQVTGSVLTGRLFRPLVPILQRRSSIVIMRPSLCDFGCPEILAPVCGEDNVTYINKCEAECAGVRIAHEGRCP